MRFIDEVTIHVASGHGGPGCVAFRREKFRPKGGPSGGNGGAGGSVILRASTRKHTLLDFRYQPRAIAKNGQQGMGNDMYGRDAENLVLEVPVGTRAYRADTNEIICDLTEDGQEIVIAKGGRGGMGNMHFATARRQTPRYAQPGEPGEEMDVRLELQLLADVGLVGLPNAGKSTLISRISSARPKIADYPFTTLAPNLGVVEWAEFKTYVVADLPGIIEGAHHGAGLGIRFLKHARRSRVLLFVIDVAAPEDPVATYDLLLKEIRAFDKSMLDKPRLVALNKMDTNPDAAILKKLLARFKRKKVEVWTISGVSGQNIPELKTRLGHLLEEMGARTHAEAVEPEATEAAGDDW
ncbi:MAG: GTPase ObgE [Deltaproteobacteria bacterium]|nr:GTPase ObgE [Deltaproteobacteria bacterium]